MSVLWAELHINAIMHTGTSDAVYLAGFHRRIPRYTTGCSCQEFWGNWVKAYPPKFTPIGEYFAWTVRAHNAVNAKLKKPQITVEEAIKIWKPLAQAQTQVKEIKSESKEITNPTPKFEIKSIIEQEIKPIIKKEIKAIIKPEIKPPIIEQVIKQVINLETKTIQNHGIQNAQKLGIRGTQKQRMSDIQRLQLHNMRSKMQNKRLDSQERSEIQNAPRVGMRGMSRVSANTMPNTIPNAIPNTISNTEIHTNYEINSIPRIEFQNEMGFTLKQPILPVMPLPTIPTIPPINAKINPLVTISVINQNTNNIIETEIKNIPRINFKMPQ